MAKAKQQQAASQPVPATLMASVRQPDNGTFLGGVLEQLISRKVFKSENEGWYGQQRYTLPDGSSVSVQVTIVHKPAKEA